MPDIIEMEKQLDLMMSKVHKMHHLIGHPVVDVNGSFSSIVPSQKTFDLRMKLIVEEIRETKEAFFSLDDTEVADGLCDIMVVTLGTCAACGISSDDLWLIEGDFTAHIADWFTDVEYKAHNILSVGHSDCRNVDGERFFDLIKDLVRMFFVFNHKLPHLNLIDNFNEVMRSNMSKAAPSLASAMVSAQWYEEHNDWKVVVQNRSDEVGEPAFALIRDDGKFLKQYNWEPPQIKIGNHE